jgi:hypothetical protein
LGEQRVLDVEIGVARYTWPWMVHAPKHIMARQIAYLTIAGLCACLALTAGPGTAQFFRLFAGPVSSDVAEHSLSLLGRCALCGIAVAAFTLATAAVLQRAAQERARAFLAGSAVLVGAAFLFVAFVTIHASRLYQAEATDVFVIRVSAANANFAARSRNSPCPLPSLEDRTVGPIFGAILEPSASFDFAARGWTLNGTKYTSPSNTTYSYDSSTGFNRSGP